MKRNSLKLLCVLVVGAFFVAAFAPVGLVGAGPGLEHNVWGTDAQYGADIGGATSIPAGSRITGWIDGVQYGINTTVAPDASQFDLYVSGDDWGAPDDDMVKDGGYDGDLLQFWFDYDPSDYYLSISPFTVTFEEGGYHNESMFFDTQTNTDGQYPDTYLRGLKINEIVFDEWLYVYIYDPGDELNEAALEHATMGYYIQTDNKTTHTIDGDIFDFSANKNDVIQNGPPGYYYINLSKTFNDFDNAEDDLRLVWKNPANWGGTPTADNIANGTDVVVDRVEWNNYDNQFETPQLGWRDYDNTTLIDVIGAPGLTQSFRRATNGSDTDDCSVDFTVLAKSPYAPYPDGGGMPGEPTDLMVHRGGGAWGGTAIDLVLEWIAPTVDYGFLVKNIVYYDSDLSDGFQYTTYQEFDPLSSNPGDPDGAVLAGMLADANEYAFIVRCTGDPSQGGAFENPLGTNVGYKYIETLLKNPSTTSQLFISMPYFSDWTKGEHIAGPDGEFGDNSIIDSVLVWNYTTQQLDYRSYGLFGWENNVTINPGDIVGVTIITTSPYDWKIVGSYDDTFEFTLQKNPTTTSQTFCSLPYHTTYQRAEHLTGTGNDFVDNTIVDSVLKWNYTAQALNFRSYGLFGWEGNFTIDPMPGGHIGFTIITTSPYQWKPRVKVL